MAVKADHAATVSATKAAAKSAGTLAALKMPHAPMQLAQKHRRILSASGEFEPFKILISAIFALLVLAIIISAIQMFEQFRTNVSLEKFSSGIQNAKNQPNGDLLVMDNLYFENQTIFSTSTIGRTIGLDESCIELLADESNPYFNLTSSQTLVITAKLQTKVFARCLTNSGGGNPDCEVSCTIKFGEPF